MALLEESMVDERPGRLMNPTLGEYHVPVHADMPTFEVHFLDKPDPIMPMGVKPVGQIGIVGVAAAVANAVFQATGIRARRLHYGGQTAVNAPRSKRTNLTPIAHHDHSTSVTCPDDAPTGGKTIVYPDD